MGTYTYKLVEDEHGNIQCGDKLYRFEETIKYGGYMKIIDLLNKIANGEIDRNNKYQFSRNDYCTINDFFARYIVDEENLNLEILEEKKIPEKLDKYADVSGDLACEWSFAEKKLKDKINEIINYLDYLKSKGDNK